MANITIDPDALRKGASDMAKEVGTLRDAATGLNGLLGQITDMWKGDACTSYAGSIQSILGKIEQTTAAVEAYQKYVEECAEKFTQLDNDCANRIRSSF